MPSFYRRLLKDFEHLSRSLSGLPNVPSKKDKKTLRKLEKLKVNNPFDNSYNIGGRIPIICGTAPKRIVVEVRTHQKVNFLTYWCFWSYDRFRGDHEDWEPVTLVYRKDKLDRIDARIHDALVSYVPQTENGKAKVYFYKIGHTPIVKVNDRKHDITLDVLNDNLDYTRGKWLDFCYRHAESDGWRSCNPPKLKSAEAPKLDDSNWEKWGKHSVYLRI
jgi:hypothetical protein